MVWDLMECCSVGKVPIEENSFIPNRLFVSLCVCNVSWYSFINQLVFGQGMVGNG